VHWEGEAQECGDLRGPVPPGCGAFEDEGFNSTPEEGIPRWTFEGRYRGQGRTNMRSPVGKVSGCSCKRCDVGLGDWSGHSGLDRGPRFGP
jgi:hypothetical protein